ncbi:MAG: hypothetical protein H6605_07375 [Flavobacteriales bacterium]|nr:hypothetical protein [Flavobacteriales bacterium]
MKFNRKYLAWILFILMVSGTAFYALYFSKDQKPASSIHLIPANSLIILESNEPLLKWNTFRRSEIWKKLKTHRDFLKIDQQIEFLDSISYANNELNRVLRNAGLTIAISHDRNGYVPVFLVHPKKNIEQDDVFKLTQKLFTNAGYQVEENNFDEYKVQTMTGKENKKTFFISCISGNVLLSFDQSGIESVINEVKHPGLQNSERFLEVYSEVYSDGILNVFINNKKLIENTDFLEDDFAALKDLFLSIEYTGFNIQYGNEVFELTGLANLRDTTNAYSKAYLLQNATESNFRDLVPDDCISMADFCFESGTRLYKNLLRIHQLNDKTWEDFQKKKKIIEKKHGLDLEIDFYSWLGNEALILRSGSLSGETSYEYIILKMVSAKSLLQKLEAAKTKDTSRDVTGKLSYKRNDIGKVNVQDLLGFTLGKAFGNLNTPYYILLNGHLVFGNSVEALISYIDKAESGKMLGNKSGLKGITANLTNKSNLILFENRSQNDSKRNEKAGNVFTRNLQYFPKRWMQLKNLNGTIKLSGLLAAGDDMVLKDYLEQMMNEFPVIIEDSLFAYEELQLMELGSNTIKLFYGKSDTLKSEVESFNGIRHGRFREYYPSGNLKTYGKYRKGVKTGTWYQFGNHKELLKKDNYPE